MLTPSPGINPTAEGTRGQNISEVEAEKQRQLQAQTRDIANELALKQMEQQQTQFGATMDYNAAEANANRQQAEQNAIYGALGGLGSGILGAGLGALGNYLKPKNPNDQGGGGSGTQSGANGQGAGLGGDA